MRDYDRMFFSESVISLFWAVIKDKRKRGKFTLQSVADAAGVDKSKISRDFSGAPNWQLNTMVDYASALGIDLEIRARDRQTGAIITPSGPVESPYLMGKSSGKVDAFAPMGAESGTWEIDTSPLNDDHAVLRVFASIG